MTYFERPVEIGGKNYIAKFDVCVLPGTNNYRTHQVVNVDLSDPGARLAGKEPTPSSGGTDPRTDSLIESDIKVNIPSLTFPTAEDQVPAASEKLQILAEQTPWQEYLEWYTRQIGELTRRQFSPPEERETVWQRYLHQQEKEREIEKALKTVEILGTVPEEYAELLEDYRAGFNLLDPLELSEPAAPRIAKRAARDIRAVERKEYKTNGGKPAPADIKENFAEAQHSVEPPYRLGTNRDQESVKYWQREMESGVDNPLLESQREGKASRELSKDEVTNAPASFGITRLNDYIHVQNQVYETLLKEGFFGENNRRTVTNKDSGKVIEIGKPGIMETFGKGNRYKNLPRVLKDLKLASVRLLPDMLENGTILDPDTKNKHKKNSSLTYSYIRSDLTVDGTTYPVYIDIRQSPQKNMFWVHSIRTNESQLLEAGSEITDNDAINEQLTSADDHTISDGKVNPQSGGMASTEIDTDYLSDVNSGDMETAQRIPAEQTPWQEYLEWYTRQIGELTRRQLSPPEERETVWQRYLLQNEKEREIEKALKTVEILGTVPEEYAELLEEAPGTDALVALRHWEDRRRKDN